MISLPQWKRQQWVGILLVLMLVLGSTTSFFRQFTSFPTELRLFSGNREQLRLTIPATVTADVADPDILTVNGADQASVPVDLHHPFTLFSKKRGHTRLTLRLFGTLPLKTLNVRVLPDIRVIPGGQSIGVKLRSQGVLVVGHHRVPGSEDGKSPGERADIRAGDYILEMNGRAIRDVNQVAEAVREAGEKRLPIDVLIMRDGQKKRARLHPAYDPKEKVYRIGLYIRDSAAGVGTLTFYDPERKVYGALGHVISDMDTGKPISVGGGKIVRSNVNSIRKGTSGEPGEKRAIFFQEHQVLGTITKNTPFGIFGNILKRPENGFLSEPVPVALNEQVKEGPAEILTVVEGEKVERFDIEIVHVNHQRGPATKGMIVKVTDPRLLSKTGGIVQGMSGSPILQDGKLVGAVTHVFVNDPTTGYGTFIEWMLQDAGIFTNGARQESLFLYGNL
ncbi:stage IV sporulation protein B [Planifilum fimeticola]|uniref:Stage IV sporulation protein B n=1 Tax=Planifilum fimeticola TaxID=201975 RepID=A0A2T0LCV1_9BACL|nr:stage IV sporulation protein B [Planifilum fimeticola]